MPLFIARKDYEFLLLSEKFCSRIDKYIDLLGLDPNIIEEFKSDNELFTYVFNHGKNYGSCAESFTRVKIDNMRSAFAGLDLKCKSSENYSFFIGQELEIEPDVYIFHYN